jgi:hypothetical protein
MAVSAACNPSSRLVGRSPWAIWRSSAIAVASWIPVLWLVIVATFVVPGNGAAGLITAVPMTAAALGTAYYAWKKL